MRQLNVTELINRSPITRFQIRIYAICALIYFLAGIDFQIIGVAAPVITKQYSLSRSSMGWVFSAGTLGQAFGALVCGMVADRLGPKRTLMATILTFGLATLATAVLPGFTSLVGTRFITGLGLGGVVPCLVAIATDYAPKRRRATIVTFVLSAFPLGAMTGASVSAYIISHSSWRELFYTFGLLPLLAGVIALIWLPESIHFSLAHHRHTRKIGVAVSKISKTSLPADTSFFVSAQRHVSMPVKHLFVEGRIKCTLPLWVSAFIVTGALTVMSTWTAMLISPLGFTPAQAAIVVAFNGLGAFLGHCGTGRLIEKFGVAQVVMPAFALTALAVALFPVAGRESVTFMIPSSFIAGLFLGFCHASVLALSALIYPPAVRSTGVGFTMSMCWFGSAFTPLAVGFMVANGLTVAQIFLLVSLPILLCVACIWALATFGHRDGDEQSPAGVSSVSGSTQ